jgi:hypothetical protein
MSLVANTVTRYDATKSVREDFADVIYNIAPTDCPLMSNIGRDTAKQTYTEWQTDTLATPNTGNAVIEGDDAPANDAFVATNRVGNFTQISRKVVQVSGTVETVGLAGIKSMLGYEMAKKAKELKRDMEAILTSDQIGVVGNNSTARKLSALGSWIITNYRNAAAATGGTPAAPAMSSGSDGYPATAAVDNSTPGDFAEADLKAMIQDVWTEGGDVEGSFVMAGPFNKTQVSGFTGIATRFRDVPAGKQAQIVGAADVYVSDFGTVNIVPNRFQPENRVYMIDPSMLAISYLRSFRTIALAKTGDNTKRMLLVEYTLKVRNQKGLGTVRSLTTS